MEISEDGFLEELLGLRRSDTNNSSWNTNPPTSSTDQINAFYATSSATSSWGFEALHSPAGPPLLDKNSNNESYEGSTFSSSVLDPTTLDGGFGDFYAPPCLDGGEYGLSMMEDEMSCKAEPPSISSLSSSTFNHNNNNNIAGMCMDMSSMNNNNNNNTINTTPPAAAATTRNNSKGVKTKVEGQPSKNLMAERRRRKRLNDRLSMLRSVVPKISKMDRTSILGDTIDYMKELIERINKLQEEVDNVGSNKLNNGVMSIFKEDDVNKPNDVLLRNSPKFEVERRNVDTRVEICCAGKSGLLLSTVTTLEALGLEIQQCVISCFNDFSLQASCSEEMEQRSVLGSEDIKQALFRNAGYGGRCL